jgi:asparagine synthase (glutamine-hydrolysing)
MASPNRFQQFPPGHFYSSKTGTFTRYYNPQFYLNFEATPPVTPSTPYDPKVLREAFEAAVEKRLMSDVPFGRWPLSAGIMDRVLSTAGSCCWLPGCCRALPAGADLVCSRTVSGISHTPAPVRFWQARTLPVA